MLMVDMRNMTACLTIEQILASGRRWVSNPVAFASFASGISATAGLLLEKFWQQPASASGGFAFFRIFLHEVLPQLYDVRHLEKLGGRFCLRLTGIGDFTVIALNRRVVTLRGAPLDADSGPVIDTEMRPDVFLAFCNELVANISERTLEAIEVRKATFINRSAS
jgi:hypothetical protein